MPATPGLVPNIRLDPQEIAYNRSQPEVIVEAGDDDEVSTPHMDDKGNILKIEHEDGSITVSLDGSSLADRENKDRAGWFDNLAEYIDANELSRISHDLLQGIEEDIESRKEYIEDRAQGLKLLGLKIEIPGLQGAADGAPVEGMSKVRHPLLLEAVLRFQANARSELLPTDGPVKIRNDNNNANLQEDTAANSLERDMNHYLTVTAHEYYPDTDRMLFMTGFGGCGFKKVYFCPLRNRPVSEAVDADDIIVNNSATDLRNAKRVTHRSYMKPSVVKRLQILGTYRDIELSQPHAPKFDAAKLEKMAQQGVSPSEKNIYDRDREIYECYCELDIKGYEHKWKGKETGLEIPYCVTIDVSSKQILSIVRNYDEDTEKLPEPRANIVKYPFVPGMGFYDIGLLHILGNTTNAVTAAWRELLDAGMYSNFPGFLIADTGARQNTNLFRIPPGGGALVKTGNMSIKDAIMALPYNPPSPALMQLVDNVAQTGMRIGGTSEQQVGEGRADAPVGTTLAMIEQASKVMNSVHKRLHAAQAEEFQLLVRTFKEHPESFWQKNNKPAYDWDEQTFLQALEDCELTPQADPNTSSHTQRLMKIVALKQLQAGNPSMYDPIAIDTAALKAIGWSNPEQFFVPPSAQGQIPPELQQKMKMLQQKDQEIQIKDKEIQAKAALDHARAQEALARAHMPQGAEHAPEGNNQPDEAQMMIARARMLDAQTKARQIGSREQELSAQQQSDDLDRMSKEHIEKMNIIKELIVHPEISGLAQSELKSNKE